MATRKKAHTDDSLEEVRDAVQTIGVDLAKSTQHAGEALRKAQKALNSSAGHFVENLSEESAHAVEGLRTQMRTHPLTYAAAAVGVGFAFGFLVRRR